MSLVGRTLSHYRLLEEIGSGGMGVVYRALDERLQRDVAIKVLPAGAFGDDSARQRLEKEARALSRLKSASGRRDPASALPLCQPRMHPHNGPPARPSG